MGISMDFYAGDPDEIGRALDEDEHDGLRDGSIAHAHADFSLHLSPDHLDLLSEQIAVASNRAPVLLLDSLESHLGGTEDESSADVVSPSWVAMVAAVSRESVPTIARRWMNALSEELGEPEPEDGSDVEKALLSLIDLCRAARERGTSVVFAWSL